MSVRVVSRLREIWHAKGHASLPLASLRWVSVEPSAGLDARWAPDVTVDGQAMVALLVPTGTRVTYRIAVPPRAWFRTAVAVVAPADGHSGPVRFTVRV